MSLFSTITQEQFNVASTWFLSLPYPETKTWNWNKSKKYLYKFETKECLYKTSSEESQMSDSHINGNAKLETSKRSFCEWEYNIVYSQIYQVPCLYFRVIQGNRLVSLEELKWTGESDSSGDSPDITLGIHPVLDVPYYFVHPCETRNWMGILLDELKRQVSIHYEQRSRNLINVEEIVMQKYMLTWLNVVGARLDLAITTKEAIQTFEENKENKLQFP